MRYCIIRNRSHYLIYVDTAQLDLILWPVIQAINFRYVPPSLRVLFQNATDVVWTMLLSYLKHHVSCHESFITACMLNMIAGNDRDTHLGLLEMTT